MAGLVLAWSTCVEMASTCAFGRHEYTRVYFVAISSLTAPSIYVFYTCKQTR